MATPAAAAAAAAPADEPLNDNDNEPVASSTNPRYAQALHDGHLKGNFPEYYAFHPFVPRITALLGAPGTPASALKQDNKDALQHILHRTKDGDSKELLLIADWGCNSGDLTVALSRRLRELQPDRQVAALGLDLDTDLIRRANCNYTSAEGGEEERVDVTFAAVDLVSEWPRAEELMRAFLEEKQQADGDNGKKEGEKKEGVPKRKFNLLTIFSTTMWIHLVHGGEALKNFLVHASEWTHCLVIEPQTHKNYKTARKRLKRVGLQPKEYFDTIAMWGYPHMLMTHADWGFLGAFEGTKNMGKSSDWGRELHIFWKKEEVEGGEEGGKGLSKKREREESEKEEGQEGGGAEGEREQSQKVEC